MKLVIDIPTDQYNEIVYINYERLRDIVRDGVVIEKCEDAISREAVEKLKKDRLSYDTNTTVPNTDIFVKIADIKELPPVIPQRMQGEWIPIRNYQGLIVAYKCSKCEKTPRRRVKSDYCPNCGADMSGGGEE